MERNKLSLKESYKVTLQSVDTGWCKGLGMFCNLSTPGTLIIKCILSLSLYPQHVTLLDTLPFSSGTMDYGVRAGLVWALSGVSLGVVELDQSQETTL